MNTLDFANFYADRTWLVFPCKPNDKTPLVKWADEATTNKERIREWWTKHPDANIGIATGKRSGIVVIDVDAAHGGYESLEKLLEKNGKFPQTPISKTGGGGEHIVFMHPQQVDIHNSAGKIGPGLDVRGDGGYIVAAPSIHPNGKRYEWSKDASPSKTKLAPMPTWLIHALIDDKPVQQKNTQSHGAYVEGGRNQALASLAGSMRRRGMSEAAIYNALLVENADKCVPPLEQAEVMAIAASVSRYDASAPMPTVKRDRLHSEWAFIKSVYEYPSDIPDFVWLSPDDFATPALRQYWFSIRNNGDSVTTARECGILADLDKYKDFDTTRVDAYAKEIAHLAKLDRVSHYADALHNAAEAGDLARVDKAIYDINRHIQTADKYTVATVSEGLGDVIAEIKARSRNPNAIWGIDYPDYPKLSSLTGGKQKGEVILLAGEPKVGKSWWVQQDALSTAITTGTPTLIWSGELRQKQINRRLLQLCGVDGRRSKTGEMSIKDWQDLEKASELLRNAPLYLLDSPLNLSDVRTLLQREKARHNIEYVVFDYAMLISAPGKDENEKTGNISREMKIIASELDLAILLIASVNKGGMDVDSANVAKSNVRGSGQQIHDADVVYILTKYHNTGTDALFIDPKKQDNMITLHIAAGRELDHNLPGGVIHYERINGTPKFKEYDKNANK